MTKDKLKEIIEEAIHYYDELHREMNRTGNSGDPLV